MNKRYTIRYYNEDKRIVTGVNTWDELNDLLKGDAKNCFVETKINSGMNKTWHDLIAKHNQETLTLPPSNNQL